VVHAAAVGAVVGVEEDGGAVVVVLAVEDEGVGGRWFAPQAAARTARARTEALRRRRIGPVTTGDVGRDRAMASVCPAGVDRTAGAQ